MQTLSHVSSKLHKETLPLLLQFIVIALQLVLIFKNQVLLYLANHLFIIL